VLENAFVTDFATNEFTKWYEAQTNVHLDWQVIPMQDAQNKVNVMLASGDFPEILLGLYSSITPAVQQLYGGQGVFVPLNKWIDQYGVYTKQMFADYPLAKTAITAADGNIYAMPQVNVCYHCSMSQKLWINQQWLDKLSLQMPTTTDELTQVLTAFKTKDPNGDGKADEIPLTGCNDSWQTTPDYFLMNSFIFDPGGERLIAQNGKVAAIYAQPEWQAGLKYMHSLYQNGLLAETIFTQGRDQLLQVMNKPDPQLIGAIPAGAPGTFISTPTDANARWRDFAAVPALKGPQGVQIAAYDPYQPFILGNFVVTKACKHPDIAFRWCDGLYERETTLRSVIGVPGQDWSWAKPGDVGTDGKPAIWVNLVTSDAPSNVAWRQTGPSYRSSALFLGQTQQQGGPINMEVFLYQETMKKYAPYKEDAALHLPPLYFSTEQSQQVAELAATIDPYVSQALANFAIGKLDVDRDWQKYLDTLNSMGLPQYLQAYQAAYDKAPKS
jgi:putative aldouronate transport system substrate-binding protein